jgi:hypothetical protein
MARRSAGICISRIAKVDGQFVPTLIEIMRGVDQFRGVSPEDYMKKPHRVKLEGTFANQASGHGGRASMFQESSALVRAVYAENDNFLVEDNPAASNDRCLVYFSCNGLYYPDTDRAFKRTVIERNRFEWRKRHRVRDVRRRIFVRDVLKQFYVLGISRRLCTIPLMLEFLHEQTRGLRVTTVGASAGGYAAVLFGARLGAEAILSFSGQFSLEPILADREAHERLYPLVFRHADDPGKRAHYDLTGLVRSCTAPILYFLPGRCEFDLQQYRQVERMSAVHAYMVDSDYHGFTVYDFNKQVLLERPAADSVAALAPYRNTIQTQWRLSVALSGLGRTLARGPAEKAAYVPALVRLYLYYVPLLWAERRASARAPR